MQNLPDLFFLIAPLLILVLVPVLMLALSRMGWAALAARYRHKEAFGGRRVGIVSAAVNGENFKNSLLLKYDTDGFYLRPVFIFRLFHPPVVVPWREITAINDRSVLRGNTKELVIGQEEPIRITILETTFRQIAGALPAGIPEES